MTTPQGPSNYQVMILKALQGKPMYHGTVPATVKADRRAERRQRDVTRSQQRGLQTDPMKPHREHMKAIARIARASAHNELVDAIEAEEAAERIARVDAARAVQQAAAESK